MTDSILKRNGLSTIAYTWNKGRRDLCILYLHGWTSQRKSKKGAAIAETAAKNEVHFVSLDYTAHGESGGQPADFTIGQGVQDVLSVLDATVHDMPLLIVGNSIGGWIGLLLAERLKQTMGFLGLAPAPDITQFVWDKMLPDYAKAEIKKGNILGPSNDTMGFCFTQKLFDDGEANFMLNRPIKFDGPVRILKGDKDDRVDMDRVCKIRDNLTSDNVLITLIKGSDHHLSSQRDLEIIQTVLTTMMEEV